jgi:prolyl-tRNA editing enzyme YbaK/EbsC (Cys-tRNA(Pro) deacylase)
MTAPLSASAQRFQDFLRAQGYAYQVVEMAASTRTAQDAANALGCQVAQIAKSLVFRGATMIAPILVIASGANRVDEARLAELAGEDITKADATFVQQTTGFAIGGVPPFGHATPARTFVDADLLQFDVVWAAAGSPRAVFQLPAQDLPTLTGGTVTRIASGG